jgi:hypothetical protein
VIWRLKRGWRQEAGEVEAEVEAEVETGMLPA